MCSSDLYDNQLRKRLGLLSPLDKMDYSNIGNRSRELALSKVQDDVENTYRYDIFSNSALEELICSQEDFIAAWDQQRLAFENETEELEEQNSQGQLNEVEYVNQFSSIEKRRKAAKLETAIRWLDERGYFQRPMCSMSFLERYLQIGRAHV